jgi:hypothetical protein
MIMTALRVVAFTIAILAVLDPSLTTTRSSRPPVTLVAVDPMEDAALLERVERTLARRFATVRGEMPGAAGTVMVGDAMPTAALAAPLMIVTPKPGSPSVRIAALETPATAGLDSRIPIDARVVVVGARGRRLGVEARDGNVRVDQQNVPIEADSAVLTARLIHVPTTSGPTLLHVTARIDATTIADSATTVTDARETRLPVFFFDPRASWLSTFVRRAAERDPRFTVTHRLVTSRGVSNTAGAAPTSLRDARLLAPFATIVVGSPEQLTDGDVAGLDTFMRERGGRVVLLMDRRAAGPVDRLTGAVNWRAVRLQAPGTLSSIPDSRLTLQSIRAQEIAWPTQLPAGATALVNAVARDSTRRPVMWSVPVGAGQLFISGALDAWHYRDAASGFDPFWTNTIAALAAAAPRPVEVSLSDWSVSPGKAIEVRAWIRNIALSRGDNRSADVSAVLVGTNDTTHVRLWPDRSPGTFSGVIVSPRQQGTYRVIASSGDDRGEAPLVVDGIARAPARDERHLMATFATSRGGKVIPESHLATLPRELASALESVSRVESWHPMRSVWWIMPFALLLGAEWWWRRRRGLA